MMKIPESMNSTNLVKFRTLLAATRGTCTRDDIDKLATARRRRSYLALLWLSICEERGGRFGGCKSSTQLDRGSQVTF